MSTNSKTSEAKCKNNIFLWCIWLYVLEKGLYRLCQICHSQIFIYCIESTTYLVMLAFLCSLFEKQHPYRSNILIVLPSGQKYIWKIHQSEFKTSINDDVAPKHIKGKQKCLVHKYCDLMNTKHHKPDRDAWVTVCNYVAYILTNTRKLHSHPIRFLPQSHIVDKGLWKKMRAMPKSAIVQSLHSWMASYVVTPERAALTSEMGRKRQKWWKRSIEEGGERAGLHLSISRVSLISRIRGVRAP